MATFIMLSKLTDEGARTISTHPTRIREVNQEVEEMGAHVVSQWAVLGPYDFVNVLEAPDFQTITRVSAELRSRGAIEVMTLAAMPMEEFIAGLSLRD